MSYEDRISIATPEGVELDLTLAGVGSRSVARLLDQLLQTAVIIAVLVLGGMAADGNGSGFVVAATVASLFLVQFGYDVLFETLASGRSPGKRWTGLRVVRIDGAPIGFLTSAVRNLVRLVDFLPGVYGVGILAVLVSRRNQRLGDMAAGTLVVREKRTVHPATSAWPAPTSWGTDHSGWDVSAVTADEVATVRRFLERRTGLALTARERLAVELATRLRPKVAGPPDSITAEAFLEAVVRAKASRL